MTKLFRLFTRRKFLKVEREYPSSYIQSMSDQEILLRAAVNLKKRGYFLISEIVIGIANDEKCEIFH